MRENVDLEYEEDVEYEEDEFEEEIEEEKVTGGPNYGAIVLVLGVIIILAVVAIKFAGPGELPVIGEYPSEVMTGPDHYSYHFFMGMISGLVVMAIGGVMTLKKTTVTEIEEEVDLLEEEEEELEEGICPTCGAVIPIASDECPECGEELEPPEEEEIVECPICAASVDASETECPECGEPLSEEEEEEEEEDLFADL